MLGALAGIAVAMPVGPVGVLLVREGLVRGTRVAVGAAAGVATVDLGYAVVAVLLGGTVSRTVTAHEDLVRTLAAVVLLVVGAAGVVGWWRGRRRAVTAAGEVDPAGGAGAAYLRFVGLTAVNPLTALTFATVAVGLAAGLGGGDGGAVGPATAVAFVLGAGLASLTWQLVLAVASGWAAPRLTAGGRSWVSLVGSLVVVGMAGIVVVA